MEELPADRRKEGKQAPKKVARPSVDKTVRTMLLAILFHVSWPRRLSKEEIFEQLPLYGDHPQKALYRDLQTLTDCAVDDLPEPDDERLAEWCANQQRIRRLAITYDRDEGPGGTFGLAQSFFSLDIDEDEARAFVTLQEGFTPGTPYAQAVHQLLRRWEWLFSAKSRQLVERKRKRRARPVLLPLSPAVDYSRHTETILTLDQALEEGTYLSFDYTPLARSWDDEPEHYQRVEPFELEYRDGHWYFTGYICEANIFLDYRIDRIRAGTLHKSDDRFTPGLRRRPGVKIRYWISPMLARHGSLSARLRDQRMTLLDDEGGALVEGYAKSIWWARRLLLGYGEQVRALEPPELVQMMRGEVLGMGRLYERDDIF